MSEVPFERLVESTGWEPDLVREGLEPKVPGPRFVARLAPAGTDARAVAQAAALFDAITRLQGLTRHVLADVDPEAGASARPTLADVSDLHDRLETAGRSWRERVARRET